MSLVIDNFLLIIIGVAYEIKNNGSIGAMYPSIYLYNHG